jgi:hypothetical protein
LGDGGVAGEGDVEGVCGEGREEGEGEEQKEATHAVRTEARGVNSR